MLVDEVRRITPKVLTEEQREFYFSNGYPLLEEVISSEWLTRLRATTDEMVEHSRTIDRSDTVFGIEPGHSAETPRLRHVTSPVDQHPDYWRFARDSALADIAADLVGPNVKFHHSKLNFKWARGGVEVKWHQDVQFWTHTNHSSLTFGTYLYGCSPDQAPLGVIPGSHEGELYDLYDSDGVWTRALNDSDAAALPADRTVYLPGPAGSVTVHNCRTPALLGQERVGPRSAAAAAQRVQRGRFHHALYREPAAQQPHRRDRTRRADPVGGARPPPVSPVTGLVRR
ncbi:phytanoyl-CoA dioxygenase family protein [Streptosporangium pseudovulgare]|nr:phytanoyl-CoA dioxygenase family protein [Streptosporangium pseudovulgare]